MPTCITTALASLQVTQSSDDLIARGGVMVEILALLKHFNHIHGECLT